ncbi:MAG: hypothetical protein U5R48_18055 [Gammaproteobacteria bacterium]|nr:hypothetical protein [Gammaproteobacteria bacterium]
MEIDELLREVVTRMDEIELDGAPEWLASNFISGPRVMPVRFRADECAGAVGRALLR